MYYGDRDELFFHYTTADTAFRHILKSGTLRLSPYSHMRDPLEAQDWHLSAAGFVPEGGSIDQDFFASLGLAHRAKQQSKLLSLSVDAPYSRDGEGFGRGYALASMWEFYAGKHAGVCLAFDRERLTSNLRAALKGKGTVFDKPVRYKQRGMISEPGATTLILGGDTPIEELINKHVQTHHEALLFTKLADWEHEAEYRFAVISEDTDPLPCDYGDALRAVIVGHDFPEWQVPSALAACRRAGVDARRLIWEMSRPLVITLKDRSQGITNETSVGE